MLFGKRPSALVFTFLPLLLVELLEGAVHTGRLQHLPGRDLVSFLILQDTLNGMHLQGTQRSLYG